MADPVGYISPAYAMSSDLQGILDQRRQEARQAMLDQLNQQNVQSEMAYRSQQAQSLAADRAAQAKDREAQALERTAGHLPKGFDISSMAPDLQSALIANGYATPGVTPESGAALNGIGVDRGESHMNIPNMTMGTDYDPEANATGPEALTSLAKPTKPPTAVGSQKENEAADDRDRLMWLQRSGVLDNPNLSTIEKALLYQEYTGHPAPDFIGKVPGHLYVTDEAKGTTTAQPGISLQQGDHFVNIPRPPQSPSAFQYVGPSQDLDNPGGIIFNNRSGTFENKPFPNNVAPGAKPTAASAAKAISLHDPTAYNKWLSVNGNPNIDDKIKQAAKSTAINTIKDPSVRADVLQILGNDRYSEVPVAQLVQAGVIEPPPNTTPEQANQYIQAVVAELHDFGKQ